MSDLAPERLRESPTRCMWTELELDGGTGWMDHA